MRHLLLSAATLPLLFATANAQSVLEIEPNNTAADALANGNVVLDGVQSYGAIDVADEDDYYTFTLSAPADVRAMTAQGFNGSLTDTILYLYDTDGTTQLQRNDDFSGRGLFSQVTQGNLPAGTYYLRVEHFSASGLGSYTLDFFTAPVGDLVPNTTLTPVTEGPEDNDPRNTGGVATASLVFTRNAGNVSVSDGGFTYTDATSDYDFYQFTVTTTGVHVISTEQSGSTASPCGDTCIFLVDTSDLTTVLASNDDFGGLYSRISFDITTPGTYAVAVKGYNASRVGDYLLDISGPVAGPPQGNADWTARSGGCPGALGVPLLDTRAAERPLIGTEFVLDLTNIPASTPVALLCGTLFGTPIDLGPIGAPGCLLDVDPLVVVAGNSDAGGYFWWSTPIPYDLDALGAAIEMQAAIYDPGAAQPLPVILSNSGTATVGNTY